MMKYPIVSNDLVYLRAEQEKDELARQTVLKPRRLWQLSRTPDPRGVKDVVKYPGDAAFLTDDFFIVADGEGHRLLIMDRESRVRGVLAEKQVWPSCIAVTPDFKVVVTDRLKKLVKVYDVMTDTCVLAWGKDYCPFVDEIEERPHGVAVNSHGQILVSDTSVHVIKLFSPSGTLLSEFGTKGNAVNEFTLPFYLATDDRDNVIVSDCMNYSVKVFDTDLNFKFRIGSSQDWGQRQFNCPYGVTTDADGNIFVADCGHNRIGMYSSDGEFIRFVVSKADSCRNPCGLAISQDSGDLVYTEAAWDYANVKMYQLYEQSTC